MGEVMPAAAAWLQCFGCLSARELGERSLIRVCFACVMVQEEKAKEAAPADKGKEVEEKKDEGGGGEEKKDDAPPPPPPPPEEVVMRVFMHCEGCARKVKKILKGFDGNGFSFSLLCLL